MGSAHAEAPPTEGSDEVVTEATVASAPPPAERAEAAATMHYDQANRAYKQGHFYDAARSFDAAHAALQRPVLLLNAGRAWEQAGDPLRALARFKAVQRHPGAETALYKRAAAGSARIVALMHAQHKAAYPAPEDPRSFFAQLEATPGGTEVTWEWVGLRALFGVYNLSAERDGWLFPSDTRPLVAVELLLFTMLWDWGYWDILRIGSGWPLPLTWGGAIGYRQTWGPHELRTGIHITNIIVFPIASGLELIYLHHFDDVTLEAGLQLRSYPPSVLGLIDFKY
jgi:hypothetical protein